MNKIVYEHFDASGMSFSDIEKKIKEGVIFIASNCFDLCYYPIEDEMTLIETSEVFMENYRSLPILIKKELILTTRHKNLTEYLENQSIKMNRERSKKQLGEFHTLTNRHITIITNIFRFGTVEEIDELLNVLKNT